MDADRAALATQANGKRSRKGLIAGALALLGAGALAEAKPARAGSDGDVVLGGLNSSSQTTGIATSAGNVTALSLFATTGFALDSENASTTFAAVKGYNDSTGPGVQGFSPELPSSARATAQAKVSTRRAAGRPERPPARPATACTG
jgi:hypothetical protein